MRRWLDRLFAREEMDGDGRCATYLVRWTLLKWWGGRGLYLHHFVGDDWSRDLHDHPKRFISIGLWGRYVEERPSPFMGRWEVTPSSDGVMVHVRWSQPGIDGAHLYVAHYPNTGWGLNACERQAGHFNAIGRSPFEWTDGRGTVLYKPQTQVIAKRYRAPWIRTFPAEHIHRIRLIDGRPCWTLVIVLRTVRKWGFWHAGSWIPWREYVGSETATKMKACP